MLIHVFTQKGDLDHEVDSVVSALLVTVGLTSGNNPHLDFKLDLKTVFQGPHVGNARKESAALLGCHC